MKTGAVAAGMACILLGCATTQPPPQWNPQSSSREAEYDRFSVAGSGALTGQAFLTQVGGGVVKAAGRTVTLDPATSIGDEWWGKAGRLWVHRSLVPPSPGFMRARRTTTADADGRFRFADLPAGRYYVRTEVTWIIGPYNPVQGGLVGRAVDVEAGKTTEVVLNAYPE